MSDIQKNIGLTIVCMFVSMFVFFETEKMPYNAAQYPYYLAILLAILSLVLLLTSLRKRMRQPLESASTTKEGFFAVIKIILALCVSTILMQWVGYILAMILLVVSTVLILGYQRLLIGMSVSSLAAVIVYLIFTSIFGVPLA